jgi:hypothetical protein
MQHRKQHPTPILRHIQRQDAVPLVPPTLYHHPRAPVPPLHPHLLKPCLLMLCGAYWLHPHPNPLTRSIHKGTVAIHSRITVTIARIEHLPVVVDRVQITPPQHPTTPAYHILLVRHHPTVVAPKSRQIFLIPDVPTVGIPPETMGAGVVTVAFSRTPQGRQATHAPCGTLHHNHHIPLCVVS